MIMIRLLSARVGLGPDDVWREVDESDLTILRSVTSNRRDMPAWDPHV